MERKTETNFQKRFGGRTSVTFSDRPFHPAETKAQNETLCRAVREVIAGILEREPTTEEMLGIEEISTLKKRRGVKKR